MKLKKSPKIVVSIDDVDWKNLPLLTYYTNRFWFIKSRKYTGNSVKYQKKARKAILLARQLWLLPFVK